MNVQQLSRVATFVVLLLSAEANSSARIRNVTLDQVIEHSELIVLARPAKPPTMLMERAIEGHPEAPPFEYELQRWIVDEVVFAATDAPVKVGEVLEISPAGLDYDFNIHRKFHVDGVNKIALRETYSPESRPVKKRSKRLLFLVRGKAGYEFTYRGATEAPSRKARVLKLARAKGRATVLPGVPHQ